MLNDCFRKRRIFISLALFCGLAGADVAEPEDASSNAARFEDWALACVEEECEIRTEIRGADDSLVLTLALPKDELRGAELRSPLPIAVADGPVIELGTSTLIEAGWTTCGTAEGCVARLERNPARIFALQKERTGSVTFTLADGVAVRIGLSLMGFSAALEALEGLEAGAPVKASSPGAP